MPRMTAFGLIRATGLKSYTDPTYRQLAAAEDAAILKKLDPAENEVVHLTPAEHRAFVDAVQPVTDKYRKDYGGSFFALLD